MIWFIGIVAAWLIFGYLAARTCIYAGDPEWGMALALGAFSWLILLFVYPRAALKAHGLEGITFIAFPRLRAGVTKEQFFRVKK